MNTRLILLAFLLVMLVPTSCKKDKDNGDSSNHFTYNGQTYSLTNGMKIEYGITSDGSYEFDIFLYGGLTIFNPDSVMGSGNMIGFNLYSSGPALASGTYQKVDTCCAPNTCWGGNFVLEWDEEAEFQDWIFLQSGQVSILSHSGENIELSFDLVSSENKPITGYYKGPVQTWAP